MYAEDLLPLCKPSDLIEFNRGTFRHWAMYSFEPGLVYNVDAENPTATSASISLRSLIHVANLGDTPMHRVVRINNKSQSALRKNLTALPVLQAISAAERDVRENAPYSFVSTNCEFYCCKWKFGSGWTAQVDSVISDVNDLFRIRGNQHPLSRFVGRLLGRFNGE